MPELRKRRTLDRVASWLPPLPRWQVAAKWAFIVVIMCALGGFLTAWSGLYSVAASRGHWPGFELFLEFGMRSSVRTHALGIQVPSLDDQNRLRRGASHFERGCAVCHGSPDRPSMAVVRSMLPEPSDLKALVPTWKTNELFWIVRNGLKYTGMPAWPALEREDEVWDVIAFLRELPTITPDRYRELAGINGDTPVASERSTDRRHRQDRLLAACSQCHGEDGRGQGTAFPRLDLQTEDYLLAQLVAFADGQRPSGFMQSATAELTTEELADLARHYATMPKVGGPPLGPDPSSKGNLEASRQLFPKEGESLFRQGIPEQGLPACVTCHAQKPSDRDRLYPALLSQNAGHTTTQLQLFRLGKRQKTEAARLMSTIAARMTDSQIHAVAAYLAAQPTAARE